jgi:hypothetical protein
MDLDLIERPTCQHMCRQARRCRNAQHACTSLTAPAAVAPVRLTRDENNSPQQGNRAGSLDATGCSRQRTRDPLMARGASAVFVATAHDAQPSPQILAGHRGYDTPSPVVILDFDHCSLFLALFHGRREVHKTVACLPLISAVFTIARCLEHPHLHLHLHPA